MSEFKVPRSRAHLTHRKMRDDLVRALEAMLFEPYRLDNVVLRPLEEHLSGVLEQRYAYAVNSATAGLFLALRACGIGPGDEVITVGNSDLSTSAAISHCGATPRFCDVREEDHTLDPALVEPLIGERTRALLPVDLYGHPADVRALREITTRHGLKIVEDAALGLGARDYGRPVGAFADITVISFNAGKPVGSVGNGGMVLTNDEGLAQELRLLRSYGRSFDNAGAVGGHMEHVVEGYNLPLDPLASAVLLQKIPHLKEWTARRRELAAIYTEGCAIWISSCLDFERGQNLISTPMSSGSGSAIGFTRGSARAGSRARYTTHRRSIDSRSTATEASISLTWPLPIACRKSSSACRWPRNWKITKCNM